MKMETRDQEDVDYEELSVMLTGQGENNGEAAPVDSTTETEDTSPHMQPGVGTQQTMDTCPQTEQTPAERVAWCMAFHLNPDPAAAAQIGQHLMDIIHLRGQEDWAHGLQKMHLKSLKNMLQFLEQPADGMKVTKVQLVQTLAHLLANAALPSGASDSDSSALMAEDDPQDMEILGGNASNIISSNSKKHSNISSRSDSSGSDGSGSGSCAQATTAKVLCTCVCACVQVTSTKGTGLVTTTLSLALFLNLFPAARTPALGLSTCTA